MPKNNVISLIFVLPYLSEVEDSLHWNRAQLRMEVFSSFSAGHFFGEFLDDLIAGNARWTVEPSKVLELGALNLDFG